LEKVWVEQCRREFQAFEGRVEFTWLTGLTLEQTIEKCASLPPRAFILHGLFIVDAAGVPCEKNEALRRLHESANAPVFACFASELGMGAIGGRLFENSEIGVQGARTALRILRGEEATEIPPQILDAATPIYDWRELRRWKIPEARLPPGSIIRFRQQSFWEHYRWPVVGVISFGLFQAALIIGLMVNRNERRRNETEATMIADISSKFVNLPADQVDREIFGALHRICERMDIDLAALWQRTERHPGSFTATHLYSLEQGPQLAVDMTDDDFPWIRREILAGRVVAHRSLADMPAAAAKDRDAGRKVGIKSHLTLPLSLGGESPIGILGFNTTRMERSWPPRLVERLKLVAEIFTNALARKEADQDLRESELRLSLATDAADAGLWVLEVDTQAFWINEKARLLFGYHPDEVITLKRFEESVHPDDWPRVRDELARAIASGNPVNIEYRIHVGDAMDRWVVSRGRPFFKPSGKPERVIGLTMDITERRNAEVETRELRNALAHSGRVTLLGNLASSLAHELSQPLGAILRNAEAAEIMLRDPSPDLPELQAIINDILHDDQRAGQVIDHLRSLLKRGTIDPVPVDPRELIESVIALVKTDASTRLIKITTAVPASLPYALGDGIHLQQVLLNLIINAMDALHDGGSDDRALHVQAQMVDAGMIEIQVSDNGPGIPDENFDRLFEPFFTTKATGMGMGLPVCKTIVEAHKGKLWVAKNPGGGTRFSFTVPAAGHTHHP
jgi:PAS domain S-box-containing protein